MNLLAKYLQKKQENDGGVPAASPMPKLESGARRMKALVSFVWNVVPFLV